LVLTVGHPKQLLPLARHQVSYFNP
jgi:hypothetical protein